MDWNLILDSLTDIIGGITGGLVAVIGAIAAAITAINNSRRKKDGCNAKCCITGRPLKPKVSRVKNSASLKNMGNAKHKR